MNGSCTQGCEAGIIGVKCDEGRINTLPSVISKINSIYFILYSILISDKSYLRDENHMKQTCNPKSSCLCIHTKQLKIRSDQICACPMSTYAYLGDKCTEIHCFYHNKV